MRLGRSMVVVGLFLGAVLLLPQAASAGMLRLRIDVLTDPLNPKTIVLDDNGLGDMDGGLTGNITWISPLQNIMMSITSGTSYQQTSSTAYSQLTLAETLIQVTGPAHLRLTLMDTDFSGEALTANGLLGQVGGTITGPGTISGQAWVNNANDYPLLGSSGGTLQSTGTVGAITNLPPALGVTTAAFTPSFSFGTGDFSTSGFADFVAAGPYSLFSQTEIKFTGSGTAGFSFDALVPVPEPGTLVLFGTGLIGMARLARRRMRPAA